MFNWCVTFHPVYCFLYLFTLFDYIDGELKCIMFYLIRFHYIIHVCPFINGTFTSLYDRNV